MSMKYVRNGNTYEQGVKNTYVRNGNTYVQGVKNTYVIEWKVVLLSINIVIITHIQEIMIIVNIIINLIEIILKNIFLVCTRGVSTRTYTSYVHS